MSVDVRAQLPAARLRNTRSGADGQAAAHMAVNLQLAQGANGSAFGEAEARSLRLAAVGVGRMRVGASRGGDPPTSWGK